MCYLLRNNIQGEQKMTRRVYFSFHYQNDVWRTNQIRNSWRSKPDRESAGFIDAAEFEKVRKNGDAAIRSWINNNLEGTSVTVVVIGEETCNRKWVNYEIEQSIKRGNGIVGVRIHNLKDQNGCTCKPGELDFIVDGEKIFPKKYPVYDWKEDNGYEKIGDWVEASAIAAKREEIGPPSYRYAKRSGCGRT